MPSAGLLARARDAGDRLCDECPCACFSEPERRTPSVLKTSVVLVHVIAVGTLFAIDTALVRREDPRCIILYFVLLLATLFQYFFTSFSSPGYVVDAINETETRVALANSSSVSIQSAPRNGSSISSVEVNLLGRSASRINSSSWLKIVMDLYAPGLGSRNWTCSFCNVIQPPRSKHCHDCHKCVLQFDHHCAWLGTCIGQRNHCKFWWYILEEAVLSIWTCIFYISFLKSKVDRAWWNDFIIIILLAAVLLCLLFLTLLLLFHSYLIVTNQTTYELVKRRRILYLRGFPSHVRPFSKGFCSNVYAFCCRRDDGYRLDAVPRLEEIEAMARPYTFLDVVTCRCC